MDRFTSPWGDLDLTRFPDEPREQLRAFDAADAYALRHLAENIAEHVSGRAPGSLSEDAPGTGGDAVVLGDRWGALTTALAAGLPGLRLTLVTDSYLAGRAAEANLRRNAPQARVALTTTRDEPPARIDVLVVRLPKSLALLEDQLHRLAPALHSGSLVIGAGMTTEVHTSTLRLFERLVGPTRTTLAVRKARLILSTPAPAAGRPANPWPLRYALPEGVGPMSGRTVTNHAGVFCADRLDLGTRLVLEHLPRRSGPETVVDLGCGNGVLGTAAALANPECEVLFTDESHQAVASAEETFAANAPAGARARFAVGDVLADVPPGSVDLVLNNPPFHSHQATTDRTAQRMFGGARAALRPGGELWVVGNRHLGHHARLRRVFGNCDVVASTSKFVLLRAVRG
ncbi:methyltransferase [Actinacidiphila yeochonensis]|uniref:methyltransferase n=1 Tax=Actinacidiphila yeochonensis TaxID=89050 RepID=UPI00055A7C04|nr:methyltransferase [Actinacidiphila yeochonensis]